MSRLIPINAATCPQCGKKATTRLGYSQSAKGSLWRCETPDCGKIFVVAMLQLAKAG